MPSTAKPLQVPEPDILDNDAKYAATEHISVDGVVWKSRRYDPMCVFGADVSMPLKTLLGANKPLPTMQHYVQYRITVEKPIGHRSERLLEEIGKAPTNRGQVIQAGDVQAITGRYDTQADGTEQANLTGAIQQLGQNKSHHEASAALDSLAEDLPYTGPSGSVATARWRRLHAGGAPPVQHPWPSSPSFAPGAIVQTAVQVPAAQGRQGTAMVMEQQQFEVVFAAEGEIRSMHGKDCRFGDAPCHTPARLRQHCATQEGFKFYLYDNETEAMELRQAAGAVGKVPGPDPWSVAPWWDGSRETLPLALVEAGAIHG